MFFILFLLFVVMQNAICSEQNTIFIEFPDSTEPVEFSLARTNYFKTVEEAIQISEDKKNISFTMFTKKIFDCLLDLMDSVKPLNIMPLIEMRQKINRKFIANYSTFSTQDKKNLLVAAHFLAPDKKFIEVVASLYADALKTNVASENDHIIPELQIFVARWLMHDLLKDSTVKSVMSKDIFLKHPLIWASCAFSQDGLLWIEHDGKHIQGSYYDIHTGIVTGYKTEHPKGTTTKCASAISVDGRYKIIVTGDPRGTRCFYDVFDKDEKIIKHDFHLQSGFEVLSVVYNEESEWFILIRQDFSGYDIPLYGISRKAKRVITKPPILIGAQRVGVIRFMNVIIRNGPNKAFHGLLSNWRYINDYLLCVIEGYNQKLPDSLLVLYNLTSQKREFTDKLTNYKQVQDRKFDFVQYYIRDYNEFVPLEQCTVQNFSFIPDYAGIMSHRACSDDVKKHFKNASDIHFDPFYMRYVGYYVNLNGTPYLKTYSLLPYTLNSALRVLHKDYSAGIDDDFLKKVLWIYHGEKKTNQFKVLSSMIPAVQDMSETFKDIMTLYPPVTAQSVEAPVKKDTVYITTSIRNNLGSWLQKSKDATSYYYHMYGRLFKKSVFAVGALGLAAWIASKRWGEISKTWSELFPTDPATKTVPIGYKQTVADSYRNTYTFRKAGTYQIPSIRKIFTVVPE